MFTMNRSIGAGIWKAILALSGRVEQHGTAPATPRFKARKRKARSHYCRSNYQPHQGKAEMARRVRQMRAGRCIDPAAQLTYWYAVDGGSPGVP